MAKKKVVKKAVAAIVKPKEMKSFIPQPANMELAPLILKIGLLSERLDRIVARLSTAKPIKKDM